MDNHTDHPLTLTVEQAAKLLGIGRSTAYELVHTGDIPSLRLGRRIVVPVCQVEAMLGAPVGAGTTVVTSPEETRIAPPHTARSPMATSSGEFAEDQARTLF